RIADVGVDLHQEVSADDHGLGLGVVDVGGDDGPAPGDLVADELGLEPFADGDELHLGRDVAPAGVVELGDAAAWLGPEGLAGRAAELVGGGSPALGRPAVVAGVG